MSITPTLQARATYEKFSKKEGNQHIAGQFAIEAVLQLVQAFKVRSILELGLGIGSFSDAILNFANTNGLAIDYTGTELNDFCLGALAKNVDRYSSIDIKGTINDLNPEKKFDLIIIDGVDKSLEALTKHAGRNTVVFVEGGRFEQVVQLKKSFPDLLHTGVISDYKNAPGGPFETDKWSCGGGLFILYPNLQSRMYWLQQRLRTAYIWRKRRFIS
ncbi:MAG TPA: hypothetical protein VLC98_07320 [Phnomibacter sp.]|nr:hypothetical protein [Phnomibacter sp.]